MLFLDGLRSITTFVLIGSAMFQCSNVLAQSARARSSQMNVLHHCGRAWRPNGPLMHELVEDRPEAAEIAKLCSLVSAHYAAVAESHEKAHEAVRQTK